MRETQWDQFHVLHSREVIQCILLKYIEVHFTHVSYSQKKTVVELRWPQMTFGGSPMKTIAWVITEDLSQRHSEWMKMFRCGKEVVEISRIDLTWAGHEIDLTSGHEYKIQDIQVGSNYWPHKLLKVWKHWVNNCGRGRVSKLLNCVLKLRHLTWPGDLTWYDLGSTFLHKNRNGWMNSYGKVGGSARRHFPAICEKPMGAHMYVPPGVRGLKY